MSTTAATGNGAPQTLPACLDATKVAKLYGKDMALLRRCVRSYCHSLEEWEQLYQQSCMNKDAEQARKLAHKLKGAAANLGDTELSLQAAAQENVHRENRWGSAVKLTNQFRQNLLTLHEWLDATEDKTSAGASQQALDIPAMLGLLCELKAMLDRHAFVDATTMDRLQPLTQSAAFGERLNRLLLAVDTFDYASAKQHCTDIIQELENDT